MASIYFVPANIYITSGANAITPTVKPATRANRGTVNFLILSILFASIDL